MHDEDRIVELLLWWEDAWDCGEDVSAEELAPDRPDLWDKLRQRITALKAMDWMNE